MASNFWFQLGRELCVVFRVKVLCVTPTQPQPLPPPACTFALWNPDIFLKLSWTTLHHFKIKSLCIFTLQGVHSPFGCAAKGPWKNVASWQALYNEQNGEAWLWYSCKACKCSSSWFCLVQSASAGVYSSVSTSTRNKYWTGWESPLSPPLYIFQLQYGFGEFTWRSSLKRGRREKCGARCGCKRCRAKRDS